LWHTGRMQAFLYLIKSRFVAWFTAIASAAAFAYIFWTSSRKVQLAETKAEGEIERANAEIKRNDDLAAKEIVNERTKSMAEKEALVKAVNVQRGTNDMSDVHVYDVLRGKWMVDDESELPAPLRNIGNDAK